MIILVINHVNTEVLTIRLVIPSASSGIDQVVVTKLITETMSLYVRHK